jgi:hypothetical protein
MTTQQETSASAVLTEPEKARFNTSAAPETKRWKSNADI